MGLFDIFKKTSSPSKVKVLSHEEKLNYAYTSYKKAMVDVVFPGGCEQVDNIILSLTKICDITLNDLGCMDYSWILSIYSDTFIHLATTDVSNDTFLLELQTRHSRYIKDEIAANDVFEFCKSCMINYHFPGENAKIIEVNGEKQSDPSGIVKTIKIRLDISPSYLELYLETAFKKKAHMYNIPGFRKGRAPRSLIEKTYGDSIFWNDAMEIAIISEGKRKLNLLGIDSNEYPSVSLINADRINGITADVEYINLI